VQHLLITLALVSAMAIPLRVLAQSTTGETKPIFDEPPLGNALVDVSAAISWRAYKIAQGRVEFPCLAKNRAAVGTNYANSRLQTSNVAGYATWQPAAHVLVSGSVGWLGRPSLSSSTGSFHRDEPDTLVVYGTEPGAYRVAAHFWGVFTDTLAGHEVPRSAERNRSCQAARSEQS
jgi:hypothetical protein